MATTLKTTLIPVRLERTREVLRELLRSVRQRAAHPGRRRGADRRRELRAAGVGRRAADEGGDAAVARRGWRCGSRRRCWPRGRCGRCARRLLPDAWCVQLRCLPLTARALWASDAGRQRRGAGAAGRGSTRCRWACSRSIVPPGGLQAMPGALVSLAASWVASCVLGAAALAWQRRGVGVRASRAMRARAPEALLAARPGQFAALLWWPAWRGALTPGARVAGRRRRRDDRVGGRVDAGLVAGRARRGLGADVLRCWRSR